MPNEVCEALYICQLQRTVEQTTKQKLWKCTCWTSWQWRDLHKQRGFICVCKFTQDLAVCRWGLCSFEQNSSQRRLFAPAGSAACGLFALRSSEAGSRRCRPPASWAPFAGTARRLAPSSWTSQCPPSWRWGGGDLRAELRQELRVSVLFPGMK